jgi:hypothetical protein
MGAIPCHNGGRCNWPACPQSCDGRPGSSSPDKVARDIVKKWTWDCGDSLQLSFVQSELLQQRIVEALALSSQERNAP